MAVIEPNLLQLKFLGQPLGVLAYRPDGPVHALELDRVFLASGHDLSPLSLPLDSFANGPRLFRPGDSPFAGGLPGLIADSLPDAWGERMLRHEMPEVQTLLGKLAAIGPRGPGAITFEPVLRRSRGRAESRPPLAHAPDAAHPPTASATRNRLHRSVQSLGARAEESRCEVNVVSPSPARPVGPRVRAGSTRLQCSRFPGFGAAHCACTRKSSAWSAPCLRPGRGTAGPRP